MSKNKKINQGIKKLKQFRKAKEITKTILSIAGMGGLALFVAGASRNPKAAPAAIKELSRYSKSRIKECLKRLSLQNYIRYDERDLTKPIFLTAKGLKRQSVQTLKEKIRACTMRKWDHIWRLVTFDVKEKVRYKRDGFRRCLNSMNFYKLQKNIYIIPFPIEREIENLIEAHRLWNNAHILHVANLGREEEKVKRFFLENVKKDKEG